MIPIKLEIQGLYSYKERQTIDFTQLTAAGLFGIFGAVGSGKSSILEAIMLALYGNTERLAARGEKTSMVNLQSDVLSLSFEFKAGKNNSETYKATYLSKRNKKNFDDVRPAEHNFYHKNPDDGWMPIELRAEKLIGMKMEHFRQTVIIPQGKFRDFIEQKPLARAEMMKELFGLERFDLSAKTGSLFKKNNEEKIKLQTQLQSLQETNLEALEAKQSLLRDLLEQKSEEENLLRILQTTFHQQKSIQEKYLLLTTLKVREKQLLAEKPVFEKKKEELRQFRKAVAVIQPVLNQLKEKEVEREKYAVSLTECSRWKTTYEESVFLFETEERKLLTEQARRSDREAKIRDLHKTITINALKDEVILNDKAVNQLLPQSERTKNELAKLEQQIQGLEVREEQAKVPNTQLLSDLKQMASSLQQLEAFHAEILKTIQELDRQKISLEGKITVLEKRLPSEIPDFGEWILRQNLVVDKQHQLRDQLIQQQGLSAYSLQLTDGNNCPLCGSTSHPQPLSHHFDNTRLEENSERIHQLKAELDSIRAYQSSWEKESLQLENVLVYLKQKNEELSKNESEEVNLIQRLKALEITSKDHLLLQLKQYEKALEEHQGLLQHLRKLRQEYQKQKEQSDRNEQELRAAEQKLLTLHTNLSAQQGEIKFPDFIKTYRKHSKDSILEDIQKVQKSIDDLEIKLKRTQDKLKEERKAQATNLANLQHFTQLLAETKEKQVLLKERLARQLIENDFSTQHEVTQLLNSSLNPEQWEKEITTYESQVELVRERLQELMDNQEVVEFKEETFKEMSLQLEKDTYALEQLKTRHTLLHQEVQDMKIQLQQKQELEQSLAKVEKRAANLKELEKLFKGNGFVKFMSSIYLKELCHTANHRFMKLTKNSLSLEIDEDNNFWVRDYLNGGRKRLLKSLSGGQTFQASLCLALALAEKVKSLNRADQSFFFLDEGFGALDRASLRTVFEALKTLRHEHRIVGIISHVEELQQEIEVYAEVELDAERGSLVSYSF